MGDISSFDSTVRPLCVIYEMQTAQRIITMHDDATVCVGVLLSRKALITSGLAMHLHITDK